MNHVYKKDNFYLMEKNNRFAMYPNNEDYPVKGKVLSIAYGYKDCFCRIPESNFVNTPARLMIDDIDILDKYVETDITQRVAIFAFLSIP